MSVIKKPDFKIFAQDAKAGEVETFPDISRGWGVTLDRTAGKPPLEWFNAIGKRVDEWLMYLTQRGVAEWDTTLSYPKTAIVQFNSIVYVSIKETKGEQPDKSQTSWSTLGVFLGLGNYSTTTEMNLALLKKIDKANITHQTGNSTELVASQQLVTTEVGKRASKEDLNNGLNSKLNTSLTYSISSSDSVFWKGSHAFKTEIGIGDLGMQGKRMWISLSGISLNPTGSAFYSVYWPTKAGTLLTSSDITSVSGTSSSLVMSQNSVTNELAKKFDKTSIVHDVGNSTTDVISQGAVTNLLFGVAQGYFDVTDQRAVDTTYTNTTGRPIVVSISTIKTMESSNSLIAAVNDIRVFDQVIGGGNILTKNIVASFIVPRNGKYRVSTSVAIDKWVELR